MTQVQSSQNCSESCKKEKEEQFTKIITLGEERNVAVREDGRRFSVGEVG